MEKYILEVSQINTMNRKFETSVVNFIKKGLSDKTKKDLYDYLENADKKLHKERFTVFFTLFSFFRREGNNEAISKLFKDYKDEFADELLFTHVDLLRLSLISYSKDDLKIMMDKSKSYIKKLEEKLGEELNHVGILHYYAHVVCDYYEATDYNYCYDDSLDNKTSDKLAYENIKLANKVIEVVLEKEKDYAKFYATRGRICLLLKEFDAAIDNFLIAKAKEDPTRKDYNLIIGGYQDYLLFSKQLKQADILMEQNKKMENAIRDTHAGNLRLISLFTGLITIVIGNLSVITSNNEPVKLMFILNGMFFVFFGIIIVFTNLLLGYNDNEKQAKGLKLLAALLIMVGLILLCYIFFKEMI